MGLHNTAVEQHMNCLFGEERADNLRQQLELKLPHERELIIVEAICQALREIGGEYVLPFCFKTASGNRTSHHLIFVSKHVRGYSIMKDIMSAESSCTQQGVPSFEYNPATRNQPLLFDFFRPLDELENMLLDEFASQTMTVIEIYNRHHVGKRYVKKNYKDVLLKLEARGRITACPYKRRKNTLADEVRVTFPPKQ